MRILIMSDNHGDERVLTQVIERETADHVIHCGDFCVVHTALPEQGRMTVVRGNCDFADVPDDLVWEGGGLRYFVTHGHRYQVKSSLMKLSYRAQEVDADIVCFGHSHLPYCAEHDGMLFINPGSLVEPRGVSEPTYAVLETEETGQVQVRFYTPTGSARLEWGGTYSLRKRLSRLE